MSEEGRELFKRAREAYAVIAAKAQQNEYQCILVAIKNCMCDGELRRQKISHEVRTMLLKDGFAVGACIDNISGNQYLISWKPA